MSALVFPDEGSRLVYTSDGVLRPVAAGTAVGVFTDAAGTVPAAITAHVSYPTSVAGSTVLVDAYSRLPLFVGPDGVDTLYVSVNGPVSPVYARADDRMDSLRGLQPSGDTTGVTDTAAIQALEDAGDSVHFGRGVFYVKGAVKRSGVSWSGAGVSATVLRLPAGADTDVIIGDGFAAATGVHAADPLTSFSISDLAIDGNRSNSPAGGCGIRWYARDYSLRNLRVYNCAEDGIWSEWGQSAAALAGNSCEAYLDSVKCHHNGGRGFYFCGPHDSIFSRCIAYSNDVAGFVAAGYADGTLFSQCHSWGGEQTNAVVLGGVGPSAGHNPTSLKWTGSEAEGASGAQVLLLTSNTHVEGGAVYAAPPGSGVGIQVGDADHAPVQYRIRTELRGFASAILFDNDGGLGDVEVSVFQTVGTVLTGVPADDTTVLVPALGGGAPVGALPLSRTAAAYQPLRGDDPAVQRVHSSGLMPLAGRIETLPRVAAVGYDAVTVGALYLVYFRAASPLQVSHMAATCADISQVGATLIRYGVYEVDEDTNAATLLAATVNDTTIMNSTYGYFDRTLPSPPTLTPGRRYALGFLCVGASTAPRWCGQALGIAGFNTVGYAPGRIVRVVAGQTDLPPTVAAGAGSDGTFVPYLYAADN